jgi:AraC-like DNA-binding protein
MSNTFSEEHLTNYYKEINYDYSGIRALGDENEENVSFRNNSSIRIWYNDLPDGYDSHWHNAIEIIMPIDNYYDVTINEQDFHIIPGDVLIIPPGEMHSIKAPKSGKRFIFLIDISHLIGLKGFSGIQTLLYTPIIMTRDSYPSIYADVYDLLVQMRNEYFRKNEYAELSIYALLINMFVKFGYNHINTAELFPNVRLYKQKEYAKKFNELLDYIDKHYMDDLTLEAIADTIGFSKFHFSRLFKQYTNFTFCDYLNLRRIKAAEILLMEPDLSITEIALQSGFMSISTFNRIFKQQKKCTPSEYRSKNSQPGHQL